MKGVGEARLVAEFREVEAAYEWSSSPSLGVTRPLADGSLPLLWNGFQLSLRGTVGLSFGRSVIGRWQSCMDMGKGKGRWERMMGEEKKDWVNGSPVPLGRHQAKTGTGNEKRDVSSRLGKL